MHVLLISGSTRNGSSNTRALTKLHELGHPPITTSLYAGLPTLPAFVPDDGELPGPVRDLLAQIEGADAVIFSTPEYAGGLPGALKNLLDWTVGGGELYGKPVGWLDVANVGRGEGARQQLRTVLAYVGARIFDVACVHIDREAEDRQLAQVQEALMAAGREGGEFRAV